MAKTRTETKRIGYIGNDVGGLYVKESDGKYYWGIENVIGTLYTEIPKTLYDELTAYEDKRVSSRKK